MVQKNNRQQNFGGVQFYVVLNEHVTKMKLLVFNLFLGVFVVFLLVYGYLLSHGFLLCFPSWGTC